MPSKTEILAKLNRQILDQVPLPEVLEGDWIKYDDPVAQFTKMIEASGGSCESLSDLSQLPSRLHGSEQWQAAQHIFSGIPEVAGNVELEKISDPRELEFLDFVIYRGQFAVAENGAIWLTDEQLKHRVVFFITQFLVLVVEKEKIVSTMHEAYALAKIPKPGFGLFLSGPSKTADIEQSLVIGAHGCRELQVYLV
ncbi:LutC/YkgG family protein [Aureliella helgolandensis]|uniref:Lactate utilization protein C n=1 Tax=Aureliella helgolandensis TaxID=2527968 RepID=A0A518G1W1_9BACT|nr:LUD domain-containing protein [Aureliella helgolandensis]QDV22601.1 Lactate utilization protein C [Aureliella helgolandensis]